MTDPTRDPGRALHPGPAGDPSANATDAARRGTVPPPNIGRGKIRHGRTVGWRSRDVVRTASLVLAMYLALQLIWFANDLFLTVFLGILFAIAVSAGVDKLQQPERPAATRAESAATVRPTPPAGAGRVTVRVDSTAAAPTLRGRLQSQFGGMSRYLFPFAKSTIAAVGGFLLVVFLSIYLAADPDLYRRGLLALLPARRRPLLATILVIVQALYVEQLPTEGTWTHRAYTSELDELEDASGAPGARA